MDNHGQAPSRDAASHTARLCDSPADSEHQSSMHGRRSTWWTGISKRWPPHVRERHATRSQSTAGVLGRAGQRMRDHQPARLL